MLTTGVDYTELFKKTGAPEALQNDVSPRTGPRNRMPWQYRPGARRSNKRFTHLALVDLADGVAGDSALAARRDVKIGRFDKMRSEMADRALGLRPSKSGRDHQRHRARPFRPAGRCNTLTASCCITTSSSWVRSIPRRLDRPLDAIGDFPAIIPVVDVADVLRCADSARARPKTCVASPTATTHARFAGRIAVVACQPFRRRYQIDKRRRQASLTRHNACSSATLSRHGRCAMVAPDGSPDMP